MDTEAAVEEFRARCAELGGPCKGEAPADHLQIIQDPEYKRFGSRYSGMYFCTILFKGTVSRDGYFFKV